MNNNTKKVFVGLSGGVDSSVASLLLKQSGYQVTGVFIKAWYPEFIECSWRDEMRDAMRICAKLNIDFKVYDLEKEYKKHVVDYLIDEYKNGRTPNPDIMCNKYIKFDGFLKLAIREGADFVATGHYAQKTFENGKYYLKNAKDFSKDQTYFLWTLDQEKLARVIFPIGHLLKKEVRNIAKQNDLFTASKKDSQGLCFLGHIDIEKFLGNFLDIKSGNILNIEGKEIGKHRGAIFYTIGQRQGLEINEHVSDRQKYYVVSKDITKNIVIVNNKEQNIIQKNRTEYFLEQINIIGDLPEKLHCLYRYNGELAEISIKVLENSRAQIIFDKPVELIAPGQSVVFYKDNKCLGGGIIS
jgi:tRNA-specific 2-thiouridylase